MKKALIVSLTSLLFLSVSSITAYLLRSFCFTETWVPLVIGITALAVSGIGAAFAHERTPLNITCFFVSAVALGFCIRAWYLFRGFDNSFGVMLLVSLAATAYIWVFHFLSRIPCFSRHPTAFIAVFLLLSLALYVVAVFTTVTTYVSTLGYYMLIESAFIIAMCTEIKSPADLVRKLTLSSYSVFAVAVFIAVAIALAALGGDCDCDCDSDCCCLDGCDLDLGSGTAKKKRKNGK